MCEMMMNADTGWSVPAAQESGAISAPEPRVRLINREKPEHMGRENKLTQPASNPPSQTSHGHQPGANGRSRVCRSTTRFPVWWVRP